MADTANAPNYEGDRFKTMDANDAYTIVRQLGIEETYSECWGILDEEDGGYIAFSTSEALAEDVCTALMVRDAIRDEVMRSSFEVYRELDALGEGDNSDRLREIVNELLNDRARLAIKLRMAEVDS